MALPPAGCQGEPGQLDWFRVCPVSGTHSGCVLSVGLAPSVPSQSDWLRVSPVNRTHWGHAGSVGLAQGVPGQSRSGYARAVGLSHSLHHVSADDRFLNFYNIPRAPAAALLLLPSKGLCSWRLPDSLRSLCDDCGGPT